MKKLFLALLVATSIARADTITINENFATNPTADGWQIFGDTNLFSWNSTNHNLAVTWDSSRPNSYFYHPLGTNLTSSNSFSFSFDLTLSDAQIHAGTFELAVGLLNFAEATNGNFLRGTGYSATNLVEFDFFMDPDYGNSVAASETDSNGLFADIYDDVGLTNNYTFHIAVTYFAGDAVVSSEIGSATNKANDYRMPNAFPLGPLYTFMPNSYFEPGFGNFNVDTLAIMSYDATGTYDNDGNLGDVSLLAHGTVANVSFTSSPNPVGNMNGLRFFEDVYPNNFNVQWQSYSNWTYVVQRSVDFQTWTNISGVGHGDGDVYDFFDTNAPPNHAFYRVQAKRSN